MPLSEKNPYSNRTPIAYLPNDEKTGEASTGALNRSSTNVDSQKLGSCTVLAEKTLDVASKLGENNQGRDLIKAFLIQGIDP